MESSFNQKFDELKYEISEIRATNEKLIKINAELISQNKQLRASIPKDIGDNLENYDDAFYYKTCEVITENIGNFDNEKIHIDTSYY